MSLGTNGSSGCGVAQSAQSAQSCPSLVGAIVRGWTYEGDTLTWSLLVPDGADRTPMRPMQIVYTGAFLVRGDGTVLDDVPLEQGRAYRIHSHHCEVAPVGAFHRVAFWPTPQFRIGFASVSWERRGRSAA